MNENVSDYVFSWKGGRRIFVVFFTPAAFIVA